MRIPKKIFIGGVNWDIIEDNKELDTKGMYGHVSYCASEIKYQTKSIGVERNRREVEKTVIHELLHGTLTAIGRPDLADDESLVQAMSCVWYQIIEQLTGFDKEQIEVYMWEYAKLNNADNIDGLHVCDCFKNWFMEKIMSKY